MLLISNGYFQEIQGIVHKYHVFFILSYFHCFDGVYGLPVAPKAKIMVTEGHIRSKNYMVGTAEVIR